MLPRARTPIIWGHPTSHQESSPAGVRRPPAMEASTSPVCQEALPTPPVEPRRVPTTAPATRPATATATRPATRHPGLDGERQCAQRAQRSAASAGLASALPWGLASTAAVAAGSKFSPAFAKATSPSARVALAISPPFFAFFLAGDLRVHHDAKSRGDAVEAQTGATWPLRLANAFYNHTLIAFGMVMITASDLYGVVDAAPHAGTARSSTSPGTRAGG